MKRKLYVSPAIEEYGVIPRNAILQVSDPAIDPEASIDDIPVDEVSNW